MLEKEGAPGCDEECVEDHPIHVVIPYILAHCDGYGYNRKWDQPAAAAQPDATWQTHSGTADAQRHSRCTAAQ